MVGRVSAMLPSVVASHTYHGVPRCVMSRWNLCRQVDHLALNVISGFDVSNAADGFLSPVDFVRVFVCGPFDLLLGR